MVIAAPAGRPRLAGRLPRPGERTENTAYLYLLPVIFSAIFITIIPFIYTVYIAFTNYNARYHFQHYDLIGFDNFKSVFSNGSDFFPVLGWTVGFMVLCTFVNVAGGAILALLLNHSGLPERNLYRTLLIIPWALPFILLVQVWRGILNPQGPFNQILGYLGISGPDWLNTTGGARAAEIVVNLWFTYPFFMTVCLAALQAIPRDLYEVADLDGAGSWARLKDITFPFLLVAIKPLLITQAAFQFNNAGFVYLLTHGDPQAYAGSPYGKSDILTSFVYKLIYSEGRFGLAAAYGIVIFFIVAAFTIANSLLSGSFKEAD